MNQTQVTQTQDQWFKKVDHGPIDIENVCISNGGLLLVNGSTIPNDHITLKNVSNVKGSDHGGMQVIMLWPSVPQGQDQAAVAHFLMDNSMNPNARIHQGTAETALRGKCDDAKIIGVHFVGALDADGNPIKQVAQVRHGRSWLFQKCTFENSWPDLGQQKDASLPPPGWVTSQHVGTVTFDQCHFMRWNGTLVYHRCPGVDKIVFTNCIDPSGKIFSGTH